MNMTGDPNQQTKPSVFGFYPSPSVNIPRYNSAIFPVPGTSRSAPNFTFGAQSEPSCSYTPPKPQENFPVNFDVPPNVNPFTKPSTSFPPPKPTPYFQQEPEFVITSSSQMRSLSDFPRSSSMGCKRKTESPPAPPLKQHITEERMAEHLSRLHISSETPTTSIESQPIRERRLYMCDEMRRLQAESIIPASILAKVQRPCTALVPWTPPVVPPVKEENNNNNNNNNDDEQPDNNQMDMDS